MGLPDTEKAFYEHLDSVYFSLEDPEEFVYIVRMLSFGEYLEATNKWLKTVKDHDE